MIKIVRTQDNRWGILAPEFGVVMHPGKFEDMIDQAEKLRIRSESLEHAFEDLNQTGNNCAEFGMGIQDNNAGTFGFIFSSKVIIKEREQGFKHEFHVVRPTSLEMGLA